MPRSQSIPRVRVERGLHRQGDTWLASATPRGERRERFKVIGKNIGIKQARILRDQAVVELRRPRGQIHVDTTMPFSDLGDAWLAHKQRLAAADKLAHGTVAGYESALRLHLGPFFDNRCRAAADIVATDVVDWVEQQLESGAGPGSIRARWAALTGVLSYGVRRGVLPANVCDVLERHERPSAGPPKHRFLTDDEMRAAINATEGRWQLLIATMLFAGLRIGEALGLTWADVDFGAREIHVRHQLDRGPNPQRRELKSDAGERDVAMMDALARLFRDHRLAARPENVGPGKPVFATVSGRHVTHRNASRAATTIFTRAGLEGVTPHSLRHTFASILIFQGRDAAFVADQLGHADPSITLRVYTKLFRAAKQRAQMRDQLDEEYGQLLALPGAS